MLLDYGITYAPDFLINAGGLINVGSEYYGNYSRERSMAQTEGIYDTCMKIYNLADSDGISTQEAAIKIAEQRIEAIGKVKLSY